MQCRAPESRRDAPLHRSALRSVPQAAVLAAALLVPALAGANVPFYFVAATLKFSVWWTIPVTVLIEAFVLQRVFALNLRAAAIASVVANGASALIGFGAYLAPLAWLEAIFGDSRIVGEHPQLAELGALFAVVAVVDSAIELLALRFAVRLRPGRRGLLAIVLANVCTVGLCVGALAWEMRAPPAASAEDRERVERAYANEIAWMRSVLQDWPSQVRRDPGPRPVTEPSFAVATSERARRMRFVAFSYVGPAGAYYPVVRAADGQTWRAVTRTVDGHVVFERWEKAHSKADPLFSYEVVVERPDGRWRVSALFRDPAH